MKRLTFTLSAAFVFGAMVLPASAQTSAGAASVHALKNATPIYTQAACRGFGAHCGPGYVWTCGPYGRCWCRPCY